MREKGGASPLLEGGTLRRSIYKPVFLRTVSGC